MEAGESPRWAPVLGPGFSLTRQAELPCLQRSLHPAPHLSNWLHLSLQGHEARLRWPAHRVSQEKSPFSGHACRFSCLPFFFSFPSCLGVGNSLKGEEMGSGAPTNLLESSRTFYPYNSEPRNYVDPAKEEHQHEENEPVSGA